ncbi:hypothetical protein KC345_g170 [Hortaea werneckii]|nr:hypothetical protein KC345_g170 [Hortaea werneckii]
MTAPKPIVFSKSLFPCTYVDDAFGRVENLYGSFDSTLFAMSYSTASSGPTSSIRHSTSIATLVALPRICRTQHPPLTARSKTMSTSCPVTDFPIYNHWGSSKRSDSSLMPHRLSRQSLRWPGPTSKHLKMAPCGSSGFPRRSMRLAAFPPTEMMVHTVGYRMQYDQMASHARTRYHFVAKDPTSSIACCPVSRCHSLRKRASFLARDNG